VGPASSGSLPLGGRRVAAHPQLEVRITMTESTDGHRTTTLEEVKAIVVETLGIEDRADSLDASSGLLGSLPELDSMAVVALITEIEERFGIEVDAADISADAFETLGTLVDFVEAHRN
jgi:acyl carrier protein